MRASPVFNTKYTSAIQTHPAQIDTPIFHFDIPVLFALKILLV